MSGTVSLVPHSYLVEKPPVTTYQTTIYQYDTNNRDRINMGVLSYMRERRRSYVYSLVLDEFERSGISRATLAARLGKAPEIISRWLSGPSNWTSDTESDLLFAISGAEARYTLGFPLSEQRTTVQSFPSTSCVSSPVLEAIPYDGRDSVTFYVKFDVAPAIQAIT
jgi:hypothetical protein